MKLLAAERRSAALLQQSAGHAAIDRYILAARPTAANPQQRMMGRTDKQGMLDSFIDPAPHTRAASMTQTINSKSNPTRGQTSAMLTFGRAIGPDFAIYKISYDNLTIILLITIMPVIRSTYDGRLI